MANYTSTHSGAVIDAAVTKITATSSSATELNILDGVTATTAELNILDGVTSTTAELNILDGVTATTAEINYIDGVTSNIQTQLNLKAPLAGASLTGTTSFQNLSDGTITITAFADEDDMSSNSATLIPTQQSVKAYVDTTAQTTEEVQDIVGAMFSSNTESGITVTYEDGDGTIDLSVATQSDNNFTTTLKNKLDAIEASATADQTASEIRTLVESASDSNVFTDDDHSKLNAIEASATADQTNAEIRTAVEAASDSNVFTDADHSKLNAIEASADVTDTANVTSAGALMDSELTSIADVKALDQSVVSGASPTFGTANMSDASNKRFMTDAQETKLDSVESNATADQTDEEIQDVVGAMFSSNTETGITATYQDGDGTIDLVVGTLNQDTTGNAATATKIASITNSDIVQLTSSQTLTNKTLTSPVINTGISGSAILDEDDMTSNSATKLSTQQSIKAYVDAEVAGVVDTAPAALNTLNELAAALGDDANFSTTTSTALGNRLRVDTASQGLTGTQQANAITNLGITSTKAELNILDGVTATAAELNIMDGVTATTAELNYTDGVTSNIQTQLDATLDTAGTGIDISSTTISVDVSDFMANGSNNRILTATGTDAMNAEANLTFDGSTLALTGDLNVGSGDFFVDDSTGRTGIGLTSADKKLEVSGDIKISGGDYNGLFFENAAGTTNALLYQHTANAALIIKDIVNDTDRVWFGYDGDIGIGQNPGEKLTIKANGDTSQEVIKIRNSSGTEILSLGIDGSADGYLNFNSSPGVINTNAGDLKLDPAADVKIDGASLYIQDSEKLIIGTDNDFEFYHDDTNAVINNTKGDLQIYNNADDKDIVLLSDDGSGGTTAYITLDGSATLIAMHKNTYWNDDVKAYFGSHSDAYIYYEGTNDELYIRNANGDTKIRNEATDADIIFSNDDGSGGNTNYMVLDGGAVAIDLLQDTRVKAAKKLFLDGGGNTYIFEESADNVIHYVGGQNKLRFNSTGAIFNDAGLALDFRVEGDTDANLLFVDGSADRVGIGTSSPGYKLDVAGAGRFSGHLRLADGQAYMAGGGEDVQLFHSNLYGGFLFNQTNHFFFDQVAADKDWIFRVDDSDGGGDYQEVMRIQGSTKNVGIGTVSPAEKLHVSGNIKIGDGNELRIGDGNDLRFIHSSNSFMDNYTGHLYIRQHQSDHDIFFQVNDGGSTGQTVMTLDGSEQRVGIGTTSPEGKVHIYNGDASVAPDSDGDELVVENSGDSGISILSGESSTHTGAVIFGSASDAFGAALQYSYHGNKLRLMTANTGHKLEFATDNNTTAMTIDSSQNVGIGTSSPAVDLHILDTGGHSQLRIETDSASHGAYLELESTTNKYQIYNVGGDLGIDEAGVATRLTIKDTTGDVLPGADGTQDLGASDKRWGVIYSADLDLSNEGSENDVDGTWGSYVIQEGEEDLFLINKRSGKKYKFMLQEVA
jgi:hypothetical protein